MRNLGNLLILVGLIAGLALSAVLFQWDSVQRAAAVTPTAPASVPTVGSSGPAAGVPSPNPAEKPGEGAVQLGGVVYNRFCNGCHPSGKAGVGPAITGMSDEIVKAAVRKGKGSMPPFGEAQMAEAQMAELLVYIKSLK
ncbi:MAG: cytochrome c [Dehalococcoidia bacterium]|nr:cytochrome c [Dehalococcoidia bacterium]